MDDKEWAVIKTLLYSDLFSFPLTENEIWYYLQSSQPVSQHKVHEKLVQMKDIVKSEQGFYSLKISRQHIVEREKKNKYADQKLIIARSVLYWLSKVPSITFIGMSGSVAVGNASSGDDIDLFIIAEPKTLFMTRLLTVIILQLLGRRRRRHDPHPSNKICTNLYLDETRLYFPEAYHDLYTARELVQIYPLFERDSVYEQLFEKNAWIKEFLPNSTGRILDHLRTKRSRLVMLVRLLEPIVRWPQKLLMIRHQTREVIRDDLLAFHPLDTRQIVLAKYQKQLNHYSKYYNQLK